MIRASDAEWKSRQPPVEGAALLPTASAIAALPTENARPAPAQHSAPWRGTATVPTATLFSAPSSRAPARRSASVWSAVRTTLLHAPDSLQDLFARPTAIPIISKSAPERHGAVWISGWQLFPIHRRPVSLIADLSPLALPVSTRLKLPRQRAIASAGHSLCAAQLSTRLSHQPRRVIELALL